LILFFRFCHLVFDLLEIELYDFFICSFSNLMTRVRVLKVNAVRYHFLLWFYLSTLSFKKKHWFCDYLQKNLYQFTPSYDLSHEFCMPFVNIVFFILFLKIFVWSSIIFYCFIQMIFIFKNKNIFLKIIFLICSARIIFSFFFYSISFMCIYIFIIFLLILINKISKYNWINI